MQVVADSRPNKLNGVAVPLGLRNANGATGKAATDKTPASPLVSTDLPVLHETESGGIGLRRGAGALDTELRGRRYHARWMQLGTVEHLRVNLRVEPAASGAGKLHVETLDLYSPRSRRMFAVRAAQVLGATVEGVESDLSELLIAVDKAQREAARTAARAGIVEEKPEITAAERAEALALLRAPDLMDRIAHDMDAIGYVGEDTNKKLRLSHHRLTSARRAALARSSSRSRGQERAGLRRRSRSSCRPRRWCSGRG